MDIHLMTGRILTIIFLLISSWAFPQTVEGPKNGPIIAFLEKSYDFGDVKQGERVEHVFIFKNTGTEILIVSEVQTTCSCTAKSWTKESIQPGKTGEVSVIFDSAGKQGIYNKVVTVISNSTNSREMVSFRVNVVPK